jgi:uncharacterized protein (DUF885 family)
MKRLLSITVFCLAFTICSQAAKSPTPTLTCAPMEDFIHGFETDRSDVLRFYDLPWSSTRFERMQQVYTNWQDQMGKIDFGSLDQQGKIDYILLRNELKGELLQGRISEKRLQEMDELLSFRKQLQELERARWKMEAVDSQTSASTVSEIADQVKKLKERVEKGKKAKDKKEEKPGDEKKDEAKPDEAVPLKVSPLVAKRTAAAIGDLRNTLKNWFVFYDGYHPDFSWWVKKPYDEAMANMENYAKYLREEVAELKGKDEDPLIGEPVGAEGLAEQIELEMLPYSAEELIQIGEREFAWCEARMKEASQEMGFGDDWKAALKKVKKAYVPPGQQDTSIAEHARTAIAFVKDRNLVTVPPLAEEIWRLTMVSPEGQKTIPYAAYSGQNIMVAYAKDEMKHDDKLMSMRGNNRHFTRITTAHELIPGHHLQIFMAARNRAYRSMFSTPFLVEGWSLYWELLLWDLKYAQTPEDRIGMLFWRMHRSARIIVSLKFHLGQMKPKEMVDFLVDRVSHEKLGATSEVRRFIGGGYSPLYQCGYMIGGLQLRSLRKELVDKGKMTDKQFHDTVLTYGPIPVELIRAGMLNLSLKKDALSQWKF